MANEWLQVDHVNSDVEMYNSKYVMYMLKTPAGDRKIAFDNGENAVWLVSGDATDIKTQTQVEAFLGGAFAKFVLDGTTAFIPVSNIRRILKVGSVLTLFTQPQLDFASGVLTLVDSNGLTAGFN